MEAFGRRSAAATSPVGPSTVFDAASLTKPLVAYVVMQRVDAEVPDIDDLVAVHAPFALADEIAAAPITVEHLLPHRSGLPNLFDTGLLRMHVPPGRRFSYSSVGYAYLQRVIEAVTGEPLEETVRRRVLEPLGMRDSSLIWQRRFEANHAVPHEGGVPLDKHRPPVASASYSLQTTAGDYARFVAATIAGTGLSEAAHTRWLAPCVAVPDGRAEDLSEDEVPAASGPLVDEVLPRDHPAVGGAAYVRHRVSLWRYGRVTGRTAPRYSANDHRVASPARQRSTFGCRSGSGLTFTTRAESSATVMSAIGSRSVATVVQPLGDRRRPLGLAAPVPSRDLGPLGRRAIHSTRCYHVAHQAGVQDQVVRPLVTWRDRGRGARAGRKGDRGRSVRS